jgi:hypothetical protein
VLSMCGIEQLNRIQLQLEPYTLRRLSPVFQNERAGDECLVFKLVFGLYFLKFNSVALNSAGSTTVWLFYCLALPHMLSMVL